MTTEINPETKAIELFSLNSIESLANQLKDCNNSKTPVTLDKNCRNQSLDGVVIDLSPLNTIREYSPEDLVITAESGLSLNELNKHLKKHGQVFPLNYNHFSDDLTLLDIFSRDLPSFESGKIGYPKDLVLGMEIVTPDGKITHCGGKVMKNVSGYDLMRLYTGSHNTLGIISAITFKLSILPEAHKTLIFSFEDITQLTPLLSQWPCLNAGNTDYTSLSGCTIEISKTHNKIIIMVSLKGFKSQVEEDVENLKILAEKTGINIVIENESSLINPDFNSPQLLTVECVTGLSHWQTVIEHLLNDVDESLQAEEIIILPQAGLIQLHWQIHRQSHGQNIEKNKNITPANMSAIFPQWDNLCKQQDGFIHLTSVPDGFEPLAERFNLPTDSIVRKYHKRLKTAYDPNKILKSRIFPL